MMSPTSESVESTPLDKIVIAIHGIGSQRRSDTIRAVARRFGSRSDPPLPVMPLGFFQLGKAGEVHLSRLETCSGDPLARIGFAEVFWADIPRHVVERGDTLEETKAWGTSVVSRAQAAYLSKVSRPRQLNDADFALGASVIEEIVETIRVLENLLIVAEKAGVFKFDLAPLLRDYVGDVQIVTEFKFYRDKIIYRFHSAMAQIVESFQKTYPNRTPEIYIVAHSEGTVISFLGLLQALSFGKAPDPDDPDSKFVETGWIRYVRGFMTIGSPIGRHILLWPKLWEGLKLKCCLDARAVVFVEDGVERLRLQQPIKWRNYHDWGDPIASSLESVVDFLNREECKAFDFTEDHDLGFSRYWLPGKAHNDYWGDAEVFGHFIDDVVFPDDNPTPPPPKTSKIVATISTLMPYLLTLLLHVAAVFVLYEGITVAAGTTTYGLIGSGTAFEGIFLLGSLLASVTLAARLPHLVKPARNFFVGRRWLLAFVPHLVVATMVWFWLPNEVAEYLDEPVTTFAKWFHQTMNEAQKISIVRIAVISFAFVAALSGWVVPRKPHYGRRTLIGCAAAVVVVIVLNQLLDNDESTTAWPVVLGGLAFVYVWWLGIMLFDLTFIWHRYIRLRVAIQTLIQWHRNGADAQPRRMMRRKHPTKASRR